MTLCIDIDIDIYIYIQIYIYIYIFFFFFSFLQILGVGLIQTHLFATLSFMLSPPPEIYIIFTALVLPLSAFIVDEVFSLSAARPYTLLLQFLLKEAAKRAEMWDKALQFSQISPEKWNSFNQLVSHLKSQSFEAQKTFIKQCVH